MVHALSEAAARRLAPESDDSPRFDPHAMEYVPIVVEDDEPVAPVVPITDAFRGKTTDLIRIVNNLTALAADDRVSRNKQQIADQKRQRPAS